MRRLGRWLVAGIALLLARGRPSRRRERIVPAIEPHGGSELLVLALLGAATLSAAGFVAVYAIDRVPRQTQFLGLSLGLAFALLAAACIVVARRILPPYESEEPYAEPHHLPEAEEVVQIVEESKDAFTRRRLLGLAAGGAVGTVGLALVVPALSLGPFLDSDVLYRTPWRRGRRLVDQHGRALLAHAIERDTFYTAYPEGADWENLAAPLVVVRLEPSALELPDERAGWAPGGILAYSKTCTHAACAVALYRKPLFEPTSPRPALVCPCHYSTFDPATGGTVLFGPAGRPLPQLPLLVDDRGHLRAAGGFSGPVGPSWWGVRKR